MQARVRDGIAREGLGRSGIVVLDALLKLRQACCDPRLLPPGLAGDAPSAKLVELGAMVEQLVAEGHCVLVFSQFTSMLALIAADLTTRDIATLVLTGETQNRADVVARFQAGAAPVFLASLRAGGVGLTLTAADTVIHYDLWWNPAVERQATDRVHRIGQTKPVFAYKARRGRDGRGEDPRAPSPEGRPRRGAARRRRERRVARPRARRRDGRSALCPLTRCAAGPLSIEESARK